MAEISEHHEIRIRGRDHSIVFVADSENGRLTIRQERDGKNAKEVCAITLSDTDELRSFFKGLRRILSSLGHEIDVAERPVAAPIQPRVRPLGGTVAAGPREDDREAVVAQARQRNPKAFAPWSADEEQEITKRHKAGESVQSIARAHKRSPRAIELRLQRLGVLAGEDAES